MRILLIGGSKSGKSRLAQALCRSLSKTHYYWATMIPADEEDRRRIAAHIADRADLGFHTVEQGRQLPAALPQIAPNSAVLLDSITAYLANEMFADVFDADAADRCAAELLTVSRHPKDFICVCDDIWRDHGSYDVWTETYRKGLAQICRRLAEEFDTVAEVTAGIPHLWKGELPR